MVGERVAGPGVTLVDDGTFARDWGACAIDDEGAPAQRNVLIDDGVLTDYMWDQLRARKEGRPSSGNGRRQSYQHLPMVRMTNTYLLAGTDDPDDIVASTEKGVFVKHLGGGQVNTATGDFVFGMTEAYLIEDGEITEPLREGNLIGNGPEVLQKIDAVADDFEMGPPGTEDPDEIIRQTPYGLYCVALGGGQVNTATGDFVFGITEAYMIENGQLTYPVRAAQLIGNGPEALRAVDAVGNDFDTWTGMCGKDGQSVPVSSGQPTLRVAELTVGGTAA